MEKDNGIIQEITERRSYRGLSSQTVSPEIIERLMDAANLAPSCFNRQPWRYISIKSKEGLTKVQKGLNRGNNWAMKAPLFILVTTKDEFDCKNDDGRNYAEFDTGMSVFSLLLQAEHEGLLAHPIAGYDQDLLKKEFEIPEDIRLLTLIVLGYKGNTESLNDKQLESENGPRIRNPKEKWYSEEKWSF
jgi:glutaredoxin-dependent peroxiredoxin